MINGVAEEIIVRNYYLLYHNVTLLPTVTVR
jgi:hypothetical protein